jgi:hypothetical protein
MKDELPPVDPVEYWDHAFWCLKTAFLWYGGLLPKDDLGTWIPPWEQQI